MKDSLFDDFPPISEKQWKQKIQFELEGKEYNQTLNTVSDSNISIKPFYHKDSYQQIKTINEPIDYKICQTIFISNEKTANFIALNVVKEGATSILFKADKPFDIPTVLKNIPETIELQFDLQFLSESFIKNLQSSLEKHRVHLNIDIIGSLCKTGNWFHSLKSDFEILNRINKSHSENLTKYCISADIYQNSGATITQQIAYALAHGFEYLNELSQQNSSTFNLPINVKFAVGSNYFFEISKLRAFKYLWKKITDELGIDSPLHITVYPSKRNKTIYDHNSNLLRTSTEYMSAILGGANTICTLPVDFVYRKKNENSERIARNQLLILKEESHFKNGNLFTDGSYYIESLTKEIAEKALDLFKLIEKNDGFLKQLKVGAIQKNIHKSAEKEQQLFNSNNSILTGLNKYVDANECLKDEIELYPFIKSNPRKTLIQPIILKRLAEDLENERLKNES